MATEFISSAAREAVKGQLSPALEKNVRQLRRAAMRGRFAAEDLVAGAELQVRRHPLTALASSACAGLAAGVVAGYFLGRNGRATT